MRQLLRTDFILASSNSAEVTLILTAFSAYSRPMTGSSIQSIGQVLVELVRRGRDTVRGVAAGVLRNLANDDDNQVAIAAAGGIAPLVELARSGTDEQKEYAAGALRRLESFAFGSATPKYKAVVVKTQGVF